MPEHPPEAALEGEEVSVPRFLPTWLGGEADRADGGVSLPIDAMQDRPERIEEPLPEDLERLLRDPNIAIPRDREVHDLFAAHLRRNPDARVTASMYLNLYALLQRDEEADA